MAFAETTDVQMEHKEKIKRVYSEVGKVVVGQDYMVNRLLVGLFTNGHILLEGVPGLAKTLTISTVANVLHLDFQRIQFTPDLLPSDLVSYFYDIIITK
jgi:MoxR-like ATPase